MKKRISITIDVDLIERLELLCKSEQRNMSNMINTMLKGLLDYKEVEQ